MSGCRQQGRARPFRIRARLRRAAISSRQRSRHMIRKLVSGMEALILAWLALFGAAAALRIAAAPVPIDSWPAFAQTVLPYGLAALAPVAGYRLTLAAMPPGHLPARTEVPLARIGRWKRLDAIRARAHARFGPFGFMASLVLGMLLNIPVRSGEFLLAVPAMNGNAPAWGWAMFSLMAADLVVMNFLYAVCFTMALRTAPLFPRTLLLAWGWTCRSSSPSPAAFPPIPTCRRKWPRGSARCSRAT